jgi:hypothetical protein
MKKTNRAPEPDHLELSALTKIVLSAAIPVLVYIVAYAYECGFALAFGMPTEFINVTMTTVSRALFPLIYTTLWFVWSVALLVTSREKSQESLLPFAADWRVMAVAGLVIVVPLLLQVWDSPPGLSPAVACLVLVALGMASLTTGAVSRMHAQHKESKKARAQYKLARMIGREWFRVAIGSIWLLAGLVAGFFLLLLSGASEAYNQEHYWVISGTPELVVLRTYGDTLVCAKFDRSTGEVEPVFSVLTVPSDGSLTMQQEHMRPLRVPNPSSTPLPSPLESQTRQLSPAAASPEPTTRGP